VSLRGTNAKEMLDKFIAGDRRLKDSQILNVGSASIVTSGQLSNLVSDNLMICGESAGQVIPLTGAGIQTALIAGKIAGEVCGRAIEEKDYSEKRLYDYPYSYDLAYGKRIKNSLRVAEIYKRLDDNDLNLLMEVLGSKDLANLTVGLDLGRIVKMLLTHLFSHQGFAVYSFRRHRRE
jgi:digeranylgeranylglycerophospholipid reductase